MADSYFWQCESLSDIDISLDYDWANPKKKEKRSMTEFSYREQSYIEFYSWWT